MMVFGMLSLKVVTSLDTATFWVTLILSRSILTEKGQAYPIINNQQGILNLFLSTNLDFNLFCSLR